MPSQPAKLVYFFAKDDRVLVEQMKRQLVVQQNAGCIEIWSTDHNLGGQTEEDEIVTHVQDAAVILYFLSKDFTNEIYFGKLSAAATEIEPGVKAKDWIYRRYSENRLLLIPIMLRSGDFKSGQQYPPILPDKPLDAFQKPDRELEFTKIVERVKNHLDKKSDVVVGAPRPPAKIPEPDYTLLPQLCARSEQRDEFKNALGGARDKPFVFVVHGRFEECPEGFRDRLKQRDIYELLKLGGEVPPKIYNLEFPFRATDFQQPQAFFERTLREEVFESSAYDTDGDLSSVLNQFQTVLINYKALSAYWSKSVLRAFLKFWNDAPVKTTQTTLIVNLVFLYDETSDEAQKRSRAASDFFDELKQGGYAEFPNVKVTVTPKLAAVAMQEVDCWLDDKKVFRDFCTRHTPAFCNPLAAEQEIIELYQNADTPLRFIEYIQIPLDDGTTDEMPNALIRMKTLSSKLGEMLKARRCPQKFRR